MSEEIETEFQPEPSITAIAAENRLFIVAEFVPFSKSRNKAEKHKSVNWKLTLCQAKPAAPSEPEFKSGVYTKADAPAAMRSILTCDYSSGTAICPADKRKDSYRKQELINWECENGVAAFAMENMGVISPQRKKPILPDLCDVLASLSMDASAIDEGPFEDWASSLGYDTDSRKAEAIYNACLDIAVRLRSGLGESTFTRLREACQGH